MASTSRAYDYLRTLLLLKSASPESVATLHELVLSCLGVGNESSSVHTAVSAMGRPLDSCMKSDALSQTPSDPGVDQPANVSQLVVSTHESFGTVEMAAQHPVCVSESRSKDNPKIQNAPIYRCTHMQLASRSNT